VSEALRPEPLARLTREYRLSEPVYVTRPVMPSLDSYRELLEPVWASRHLANEGALHRALEARLGTYLEVGHVSLFCNGTIALLVALKALGIEEGEVVTTPYSFPATPHALYWNRITPVFADVDAVTGNLDPARVEAAVTSRTRGILAVHVYGTPCDVEGLQAVADRHGLPIIYDAAHAFGVRYRGRALSSYGDMAALSFHATKLFSTGEGGALVSRTPEDKQQVYFLKNFGIAGPEEVVGPGINGKMNELQAAFGLLQLDLVDAEIASRLALAARYRDRLEGVRGVRLLPELEHVEPNGAYMPVFIDPAEFGVDRDGLHDVLVECNVIPRKYFHPLCSHYACYASLPSASAERLPNAERIAAQVLCLPLYGELLGETVDTICEIVREVGRAP